MSNIEKTSLEQCLKFSSCASLPPEKKDGEYILSAIALLRKKDGSLSYGVVQRDNNLKLNIVLDAGHLSPIVETINLFPYKILRKEFVKNFSEGMIAEKIAYLETMNTNSNIEYTEMTERQIDAEITKTAIRLQDHADKVEEEEMQEQVIDKPTLEQQVIRAGMEVKHRGVKVRAKSKEKSKEQE